MKCKILNLALIILFLSVQFCNSPKKNDNTKTDKTEKTSTVTDSIAMLKKQNAEKLNSIAYYLSPDSIEFSFVVYGKYFVIAAGVPEKWIIKNPQKIGDDYRQSLICDLDNNMFPEKIKSYIGKDFYFITEEDSIIEMKIENLKVLLVGTPHFGELQTAEESDNPEMAMFDILYERGMNYLVGEISDTTLNIIWGRSKALKKYEICYEESEMAVPEKMIKDICNNLSISIPNFNGNIIYKAKDTTYVVLHFEREGDMCGEMYPYFAQVLVKVLPTRKATDIYDADADEFLKLLDINSDGMPEFMYRDNSTGDLYLFDSSNKLDINFLDFYIPYWDCGC